MLLGIILMFSVPRNTDDFGAILGYILYNTHTSENTLNTYIIRINNLLQNRRVMQIHNCVPRDNNRNIFCVRYTLFNN